MSDRLRSRVLGSALLALATAELGARLLSPSRPAIEPEQVDVGTYFSEAEIRRGSRFARPQLAIGLARAAVQSVTLAAIVSRAPRRLGASGTPAGASSAIATGAATGAAMSLALTLPGLPLAAVARRRAITVGLATQSWRGWALDLIKASGIEALLAGASGGVVVVLTRRYPRSWWAPAAAGSLVLGGVLAALAPLILDPIFNDFTPLPEGQTRTDVLALARAAGVQVGEVYSVDASRRTTAANAYVTGLGPTKRVVLFDTLLDRYRRDEVRLVVAHELAHVRHRDVPRGVAFGAIAAPAGALAVQQLSWALSPERGNARALPALALASGLVSLPIGLIGNRLTRAVERRADAYSLELTGAPDAFVSFQRAIALQNVADLRPPRLLSTVLSTHPPTLERIGAAVAYGKQPGRSGPADQSSGS